MTRLELTARNTKYLKFKPFFPKRCMFERSSRQEKMQATFKLREHYYILQGGVT